MRSHSDVLATMAVKTTTIVGQEAEKDDEEKEQGGSRAVGIITTETDRSSVRGKQQQQLE